MYVSSLSDRGIEKRVSTKGGMAKHSRNLVCKFTGPGSKT